MSKHADYSQHVLYVLQDAGVVDPWLGTWLPHLDRDKCEFALMQLEARYSVRLRRDYQTVAELIDGLSNATGQR